MKNELTWERATLPFESLQQINEASHSAPRSGQSSDEVPSVRSMASLLALECIFTVSGGFMDAYAFIAHGHVFANAQTGNVVFCAVYVTGGNLPEALRRLPPIMACILGVSAAKLLGVNPKKVSFRATLLCQAIELLMLSALAVFAARLPDSWVVPILSFVAALQITSFDALGPWSFNSAMTTGNIKSATIGFVLWLMGKSARRIEEKSSCRRPPSYRF
jgi:uncharacterized membrane protein YoaK (UPF0700 family)